MGQKLFACYVEKDLDSTGWVHCDSWNDALPKDRKVLTTVRFARAMAFTEEEMKAADDRLDADGFSPRHWFEV